MLKKKRYLNEKTMRKLAEKAQQLSSWLSSMEKTFSVMDPNALSCIRRVVDYLCLHIDLVFMPFRDPLNHVMQILMRLKKGSSDEAYANVLDVLLVPFVVIIGKCERQWVTIRMILRCFTHIMQSLPAAMTSKIVLKHAKQIAPLRRSLQTSGEFRNQRVVMLFLFQCVTGMSQKDKAHFVQTIFPHEQILHFRRCFLVAKPENLEKGIRNCLNEYNDMLSRREIISFTVREMHLGAIKCSGFQGEKIWIDFNSFPLNISIYCSSQLILNGEEKLVLIYIPIKTISGFVLDRNNFDEELFVMATEKFTVVDVQSGEVDNFLNIRDLQCTFFMPERNRDEGNTTLEKIRRLVAEGNNSIRKPIMDRTNRHSSMEKKVQEAQYGVTTQPLNFSPRTISPILPEPRVDDSGVFTEHDKSARKQVEETDVADEIPDAYEGSDFRGFCDIDVSSSEDEKVVEPVKKREEKPKKKDVDVSLTNIMDDNSPKRRTKRKVKKSQEPKKRAPAPRKCVKKWREESVEEEVPKEIKLDRTRRVDELMSISSDEEAGIRNKFPKEEIPTYQPLDHSFLHLFTRKMTPKKPEIQEDTVQKSVEEIEVRQKVQKSLPEKQKPKLVKRKSPDDDFLSSSYEDILKTPKKVKRKEPEAVDFDFVNFSPVAQTQKKPEIQKEVVRTSVEEEIEESWSPRKTAEKPVKRTTRDDDFLSSSDEDIIKKSNQSKDNRSFVISSDEEATKVMQIVKAVVHQENEDLTVYQLPTQECPDPQGAEEICEKQDNDFFNLASLSQVKAKEPPVAEEIEKPKKPPARKRGIWLDKPIWKSVAPRAPKKIKEAKKPQIRDDKDVFDFDDSESSIPDISKAIYKFLNKDEDKENEEKTPKPTDEVFNQLKSDIPTKRKLFNPHKIVEKSPVASPKNQPKYKFFKSRNSTPSDIVIDSELSEDSDKERLALAKRRKVEQNIAKINKKTQKEKKPQPTKKRAPKKSMAKTPIVKRSIIGTNIQAGVFMANITPSSSSVFIRKMDIHC